jgi:hypothetical protein
MHISLRSALRFPSREAADSAPQASLDEMTLLTPTGVQEQPPESLNLLISTVIRSYPTACPVSLLPLWEIKG